jgi:hypothetical protein
MAQKVLPMKRLFFLVVKEQKNSITRSQNIVGKILEVKAGI